MKKLLKTSETFKEFLEKFFSSGLDKKDRERLELKVLERLQVINAFCVIAIIFIIITYIYYLIQRPEYLDIYKTANGIFQFVVILSLIIYMRFTRNFSAGSTVIIFLQYLLFIFCILCTGEEGILYIFISLIPYLVVYLKGAVNGLKWLAPLSIIYLLIILLSYNNIIKIDHSIEVLGYMFFGFINLGIFAVISVYRIENSTEIIKNQLEEITRMSRIDYLTNVLNKCAFMEILERERKRTIRHNSWLDKQSVSIDDEKHDERETEYQQAVDNIKDYLTTFSIVLIDIDRFKDFNDRYGHLFGDDILKAIGEELHLKKLLRENDIVGRFGGEEFILLLSETSSERAFLVAERIRGKIAGRTFVYENINSISITVSIGISEMLFSDINSDDVIKRADRALYNAKDSGRNCTKIYEVVK